MFVNFILKWWDLQFKIGSERQIFEKLYMALSQFLPQIDIHTYIIGHYNPSVRIIDLVTHTTYVVCVNFIQKWRESTPNDRFEKLFMTILF